MTIRILASVASLSLLTGCLMPSSLLAPQDNLPAGNYYVEQQEGKTLALGTDWIEVQGDTWFEGPGVYRLDETGVWQMDSPATENLADQALQLTDAPPAPPAQ